MTGQNTQKQIFAMIVLMFLGVAGLGAYVWFDDGRRVEAQDKALIEDAVRGADLFARNCRICHGNNGLGSTGNPQLIGPALNKPSNTLAFRSGNIGALGTIQGRLHDTVSCGRNGTPMPPWAVAQGGSLNDFKVSMLVTLITTNAGNTWEYALEEAIHEDEEAIGGLEFALADAHASDASEETIANLEELLETAESRFEQGLPVGTPLLSLTKDSCGQRS